MELKRRKSRERWWERARKVEELKEEGLERILMPKAPRSIPLKAN
jgi:hypothetical protein